MPGADPVAPRWSSFRRDRRTFLGWRRRDRPRPHPAAAKSRGNVAMREAVIVSYARTGLAKSGRGGFNHTPAMSMAAHTISHAVLEVRRRARSRRGRLPGQRRTRRREPRPTGWPPRRSAPSPRAAPRSSATARPGLNTIALAANYIGGQRTSSMAGGVDSITMPGRARAARRTDQTLLEIYPPSSWRWSIPPTSSPSATT